MVKPASPNGEKAPQAPRPRDRILARDEILAQALRANLKRRKSAAKAKPVKA